MAIEGEAEDMLRSAFADMQRVWQILRRIQRGLQDRLSRAQGRRALEEASLRRRQWDPAADRATQALDPRDLSNEVGRQASQIQELEEQNEALRGQAAGLEQDRAAAERRLQEQRDELADQRREDEYKERVDGDGNNIDDNRDEDLEAEQQQNTEDAVQAEVDAREQARDQADAEEKKTRDEETRQQEGDREDIDPATAVGTAAAAEEIAEEVEDQRAEDLQQEERGDSELQDPAKVADNEQQAETADEQPGPDVSEDDALDASDRLQQEDLQQGDPEKGDLDKGDLEQNGETLAEDGVLEGSTRDAENEQQAEVDSEREQPGQQVNEGALDSPTTGPENEQQTDLGQDQQPADLGQDQQPTDLGQNQQVPARDVQQDSPSVEQGDQQGAQLDSPSAQQGRQTIAVGQGAQAGQDGPAGQRQVDWNVERDGSHIEARADQEPTVYNVEGDGVSLSVQGNGADQQSPGMDQRGAGQGAGASDRPSINVGDIEGNQTLVINQDGVHQGVQQGNTRVAHAEDPQLAADRQAKAEGRGPQQQMGPRGEMSAGEMSAQQHLNGSGRAPAADAPGFKPETAGVGDRPGTAGQQHSKHMDRGAGGRTDGHGRERD